MLTLTHLSPFPLEDESHTQSMMMLATAVHEEEYVR
jgi:hypothetical protein